MSAQFTDAVTAIDSVAGPILAKSKITAGIFYCSLRAIRWILLKSDWRWTAAEYIKDAYEYACEIAGILLKHNTRSPR